MHEYDGDRLAQVVAQGDPLTLDGGEPEVRRDIACAMGGIMMIVVGTMSGGGRFGATACEEEPSDDEDGHCGDEHMTGARGPSRRPPPLPMEAFRVRNMLKKETPWDISGMIFLSFWGAY